MIQKYLKPVNLGSLFNVPIILKPSAILMSLFWIWTFYISYNKYNWFFIQQLLTATIIPIIIYSSIIAHEFAHILTAKKYGVNTTRIDLFMFGGCAIIESEPKKPLENFYVALAGPFLSFCLYTVSLSILHIFKFHEKTTLNEIFSFFKHINAILFIFNLVFIIYPFDGGRIVHSLIWYFANDKKKALKISFKISECILYLLIGLAGLSLFITLPLFGHGLFAFFNLILLSGVGYMMMLSARNGLMPHL